MHPFHVGSAPAVRLLPPPCASALADGYRIPQGEAIRKAKKLSSVLRGEQRYKFRIEKNLVAFQIHHATI